MQFEFVKRQVLWRKAGENTMGGRRGFQHPLGYAVRANEEYLSKIRVSAIINCEMRNNVTSFPQERFPHSFCLCTMDCG